MVKAYERRQKDINEEGQVIADVRQVVRNVSNPFWLIARGIAVLGRLRHCLSRQRARSIPTKTDRPLPPIQPLNPRLDHKKAAGKGCFDK